MRDTNNCKMSEMRLVTRPWDVQSKMLIYDENRWRFVYFWRQLVQGSDEIQKRQFRTNEKLKTTQRSSVIALI